MTTSEDRNAQADYAVLKNDLAYVRQDIAEIKNEFKDFKRFYATKDEMVTLKLELTERLLNETKPVKLLMRGFLFVLGTVTAAVIYAIVNFYGVTR